MPDTHAHLDASAFAGDRDEVVARSCAAGVNRILAVGTNLESSRAAVSLAARHEPVYAAVGIHPTELEGWVDAPDVRQLLDSPKVVAVGEIGLDFLRASASREEQREAFRAQLGWAQERGLPVSVHNRDADAEVMESLARFQGTAILHCFSGSRDFAEQALGHGCYLSFAGNVTFPKAEELRRVAAWAPLDRVLVESDAPVLAPQPQRGRRNEPAYVILTADTVAAARDMGLDVLAAALSRNADAVFGWGTA